MIDKTIVCFHNPEEINGYLSNWYKSDFVYNKIKYTSMEQYMMHQKALLFQDVQIANEIMKTNDVAKIKALGRKVRNFNDNVWDKYKADIIMKGLVCKFSQNSVLKQKLLSTGNTILAECAVRDKVWGIGLSMKDENRFDTSKWRGNNLLGVCLMQTRTVIR